MFKPTINTNVVADHLGLRRWAVERSIEIMCSCDMYRGRLLEEVVKEVISQVAVPLDD